MARPIFKNLPDRTTPLNGGDGGNLNLVSEGTIYVGTSVDSSYRTNILHGKNLFDKNNANIMNLYPTATGTLQNNSYKSLLIKIKPNTTYTFTSLNAYSDGISLGTYTTIPTTSITPTNRVGVASTNNHGTITSGANDKYLLAYIKWSSTLTENDLNGVQLEEGSTATTYEPYITPSIVVDNDEIYSKNNIEQYSTSEIRIGTWINGKPLYRNVVPITLPSDGNYYEINLGISNIDTIMLRDISHILHSTTYKLPLNAGYGNSAFSCWACPLTSGKLAISSTGANIRSENAIIVVEYTKTTD